MKLGEILVRMGNYNFNKYHQNQMKNEKVLLIAHFSVQNFEVSVESWKSYIVLVLLVRQLSSSKQKFTFASSSKIDY